jgi:hypothetical protein
MSSAVNLSIGFAQAQNQAPIQASNFFSAHGKGMATERIKSDGLNYPRRLTCHAFRARARFPLRKPMRSINENQFASRRRGASVRKSRLLASCDSGIVRSSRN